jgi:hypothetical protein
LPSAAIRADEKRAYWKSESALDCPIEPFPTTTRGRQRQPLYW